MFLINSFKFSNNVFYNSKNIFVRSLSSELEIKATKDELKKIRITTTQKVDNKELEVEGLDAKLLVEDKILAPIIQPETSSFVSFDEVPGPKILKHFAKLWSVIPAIGNQFTTTTIQYLLGSQLSWGRNSWMFKYLLDEYGPVVRLQSPFGGDVVILSRSEDAISVFANEGRYPIRSSLDCIEHYRLKYRRYKNVGPFLMYGQDWENLRTKIEVPLQNTIDYQFEKINSVGDDFISRIRVIRNRQDEVPKDFIQDVYKWSLECLCAVLVGKKIGLIQQKANANTTEASKLLEAFYGATDAIKKCESGLHLWKYIETPAWKKLIKHCDTFDNILNKYIKEAQSSLRRKKRGPDALPDDDNSILESLLLQDGMFPEDILTVFLDMLIIGVNASTHSLAFMLYHLARNPRVQRILSDEVRAAPERLDAQSLRNLEYLQACIKESLRLKPPIPLLSRVLTRDIIIHNYKMPKGTIILMATHLSSLREENFDDALKFMPERWLNVQEESNFASIPFGYGPKACLAKNLAEMQLGLIVTKILRAFKIEYQYGNINSTNKMLSTPDRDLRFGFINRFAIP